MKKIIDQTIAALLRDLPVHDPARISAAAELLRAAYPNGIDAVGGGQSPGDPPPTNPFGKSIDLIIDRQPDHNVLVEVEIDGKSVELGDIGTVETDADGMTRVKIGR